MDELVIGRVGGGRVDGGTSWWWDELTMDYVLFNTHFDPVWTAAFLPCVRACVRACVRVCVRACVYFHGLYPV